MGPELIQHPLSRADGSTAVSSGLYTVIAGVNGPVEVQRRDELPEEAAVEVNIRPSSGIGGPRERWLESVVQSVLKNVILVNMHPRTLIQITLQVTKQPSNKLLRTTGDISVIPTLLNTAFTALVDGGIPLATTMSSTLAIVNNAGSVMVEPQEKDLESYSSIHAMAFDSHGQELLDQSSGIFSMDTWDEVADAARRACVAAIASTGEDEAMADGDASGEPWLRKALQSQAVAANSWRDAT
ncbi:Hypothetical predicted protein [Lecanosticta acicola]|uniref:Exoribonuclease phosphorolytic domain-containing protein n=1 Tax=Lecanosticta acicola TaxID=111012 RepID=A0AAI8Z424_9PEZI|nr:Hypothetical predicted protein [Lecanosticta acicola]